MDDIQPSTAPTTVDSTDARICQSPGYKYLKDFTCVVPPLCLVCHGAFSWAVYDLSLHKLNGVVLLGFCGFYLCLFSAYDLLLLSLVHSAGQRKAIIPILDAEGGEKGTLAKIAENRKKRGENGNDAKKDETQKYTKPKNPRKSTPLKRFPSKAMSNWANGRKRGRRSLDSASSLRNTDSVSSSKWPRCLNAMCIAGRAVAAGRQSDLLFDLLLFLAITLLMWCGCVFMVYLDGKCSIQSIITDTCDDKQALLELGGD